jgi:hypothetical protein
MREERAKAEGQSRGLRKSARAIRSDAGHVELADVVHHDAEITDAQRGERIEQGLEMT